MSRFKFTEIILYVSDQQRSRRFYKDLLVKDPILDVPGMTEFSISEDCKLGLMPCDSIAKILKDKTPHPSSGNGIPRCELYLYTDDVQFEFENASKCGAKLISEVADRDWGDRVCYFSDPDGHVLAFAQKIQ